MQGLLTAAALGLCAAIALPASAAGGQDDIIGAQLDKASEIYAKDGFHRIDWGKRGAMNEGESLRVPITLTGGHAYNFVGACDQDCKDLNLVVTNSAGDVIGKDDAEDDVPIASVEPSTSGTYFVQVAMVKCSGSCDFGVGGFTK